LTSSWFSLTPAFARGKIKAAFCQTLAHRNWSVLLFLVFIRCTNRVEKEPSIA